MKKLQITKRDVKVFFLGMVAAFLIVLIYEWDDFVDGLKGGFESATFEISK
ncbi:MAG: hypothetical protein IPH69_15600 [Bacteroidales bacterium]|nr:hypothetical protein [Bacteroidales bacterium]